MTNTYTQEERKYFFKGHPPDTYEELDVGDGILIRSIHGKTKKPIYMFYSYDSYKLYKAYNAKKS